MARRQTSLGLGLSVLAGLGVASYMSGRRAVPSLSGIVRLRGLNGEVEIMRDRFGVPAIYAHDEPDLMYAVGFVHASERLFQMDLLRRLAEGRLAEIVGEPGLKSDRLVRTLGFGELARQEIPQLTEQTRSLLSSYCAGVNAFLRASRRRMPVEFRLLGYRPAPWKPEHCLAPARLMALGLCGNWESELVRAEIAALFGQDVLQVLDDDADARPFPAVIDPEVLGELSTAARDATSTFGGVGGSGSNNWVIGPRRTRSNGALLANDPHLDLQLPSVWYEQLLSCPTVHVRGFTVPGVPAVILGNNDRIAWGFTNSCADVQDLYVEQIDEERNTYRDTDGDEHPLELRTERIEVKGAEPVELVVRSTRRGPILTDAVSCRVEHPLSLRWDSVLRPGRGVEAVFDLCRARGWDDFRAALSLWTAPAQNVVYADVDGNIGFQHAGEVPIRASGNGTLPRRGDDPDGEWAGTIPFDEQAWSFNPSSDRIATANDRIVGDDYPHFISCEWMNGYRGERIRQLIDAGDDHTVQRQVLIQCDVASVPGRRMQQLLERVEPSPATAAGAELLAALRAWDGELRADDDGAIAWRLLIRALQEQVYGFLGALLPVFLGYSRSDMNGFWAMFGRSTPVLLHAIDRDDRRLLELGQRVVREGLGGPAAIEPDAGWEPSRDWRACLERALDAAGARWAGEADAARSHPGSLPRSDRRRPFDRVLPRRRRYHRLKLQHPLGVIPGLAAVANYGPLAVPGDPDTVWQQSGFNNPLNEHAQVGPSHRRVVDLANLDASVAILCGGQSGHPASPHYVDQVAKWRAGEVRPAPFTRSAVERQARYRQTLLPR